MTKHVLVVDDVAAIGEVVGLALHGLRGRDVTLACETSPEAAIARLAREPFDVVISDYRMPRHDGIDVLRAARATHPPGYRILMTSYPVIERGIEDIRDAGVDAYVQKPLDLATLRLLLRDFLDEAAGGIEEHRREARALEDVPA